MELPSKELLSDVLGFECKLDEPLEGLENRVFFEYFHDKDKKVCKQSINIYELMHLMKEWAFNNGSEWCIDSRNDCNITGIANFGNKSFPYSHIDRLKANVLFQEETEFEAVTKACEWILKEPK